MKRLMLTLAAGVAALGLSTSAAVAGDCFGGICSIDCKIPTVCFKWEKKIVEDFVIELVPFTKKVIIKDFYGNDCVHYVIDYKEFKKPFQRVVWHQVPCDPKTGKVIVQEGVAVSGGAVVEGGAAAPAPAAGAPAAGAPAAPAAGAPAGGVAPPPSSPAAPAGDAPAGPAPAGGAPAGPVGPAAPAGDAPVGPAAPAGDAPPAPTAGAPAAAAPATAEGGITPNILGDNPGASDGSNFLLAPSTN